MKPTNSFDLNDFDFEEEEQNIEIENDNENNTERNIDISYKTLNEKHPHERDQYITKNEAEHAYYVNGKKISISSTKFKSLFFPAFDGHKLVRSMFQRSGVVGRVYKAKTKSPYDGMTANEIIQSWDDNKDNGTEFHHCMELLLNENMNVIEYTKVKIENKLNEYARERNYEKSHLKFNHVSNVVHKMFKRGWVPYRVEWTIYDEQSDIAGTIDAVFEREGYKSTEYAIIDWKTVKSVNSLQGNWGKMCKYPFKNLKANKESEYTIQINLYRHILEKYYGIKITSMVAACISDTKYVLVNIPRVDLEHAINMYSNNQKLNQELINWKTGVTTNSIHLPFLTEPVFRNPPNTIHLNTLKNVKSNEDTT